MSAYWDADVRAQAAAWRRWATGEEKEPPHNLLAFTSDVAALADERDALAERVRVLTDALEHIKSRQPHTLGWIRQHGIIFDEVSGTDPRNWQHVAFSIYTDLCQVDAIAQAALAAATPEEGE